MDHRLVRRVSGFRVAAIVFVLVATITLVKSIFAPTYTSNIINQFNLLLNLITMISFASVFQYLNEKNYEILLYAFSVHIFCPHCSCLTKGLISKDGPS